MESQSDVIDVEVVSRKEILEGYIREDPSKIDDPLLKEFLLDYKKAKTILEGQAQDLKQYLDALQKKAAKLHQGITEQNSRMKYISDKIMERHIHLQGK